MIDWTVERKGMMIWEWEWEFRMILENFCSEPLLISYSDNERVSECLNISLCTTKKGRADREEELREDVRTKKMSGGERIEGSNMNK